MLMLVAYLLCACVVWLAINVLYGLTQGLVRAGRDLRRYRKERQ